MKKGDIVKDEFLGLGTIQKVIKGTDNKVFAYLILFNKTPPKNYNNCNNPCLRFKGSIKCSLM